MTAAAKAPTKPPKPVANNQNVATAVPTSPGMSSPGKSSSKGNRATTPRSASRTDPDSKLCKEEGYCFGFFKYGQCTRGTDCSYAHVENKNGRAGNGRSASPGKGKGKRRDDRNRSGSRPRSPSPGQKDKICLLYTSDAADE